MAGVRGEAASTLREQRVQRQGSVRTPVVGAGEFEELWRLTSHAGSGEVLREEKGREEPCNEKPCSPSLRTGLNLTVGFLGSGVAWSQPLLAAGRRLGWTRQSLGWGISYESIEMVQGGVSADCKAFFKADGNFSSQFQETASVGCEGCFCYHLYCSQQGKMSV